MRAFPLSPAGVPPYELTGLGAALFGAAAAILVGGVMLTSNIIYGPARVLVVGSPFGTAVLVWYCSKIWVMSETSGVVDRL